MQSFKFLRYALHGDLVEDRRRRREERENNAYFNGHFAVCTATLGPMEEVRGLARGGIRGLSPGQEELSLMEKDLNTAWLFSITSTM